MRHWHRIRPHVQTGAAVSKFIFVDHVLGWLTYTVDALMIYYIVTDPAHGIYKAFFYAGAWNFVLTSSVVWVNNYLYRRGYDLTALEALCEVKPTASHGWFMGNLLQFKCWVLERRITIFLIGSVHFLDPDYVTILLQDKRDSFIKIICTITLPSVILAMFVWTIYYAAGAEIISYLYNIFSNLQL